MAVATVIAPWATLPVIALWVLGKRFDAVLDVMNGDRYFVESFLQFISIVMVVAMIGVVIAYAFVLFCVVPIHLFLVLRDHERPQGYLLAGTIGAVVVSLVVVPGLVSTILYGISGAAVSGLFWVLSRK